MPGLTQEEARATLTQIKAGIKLAKLGCEDGSCTIPQQLAEQEEPLIPSGVIPFCE